MLAFTHAELHAQELLVIQRQQAEDFRRAHPEYNEEALQRRAARLAELRLPVVLDPADCEVMDEMMVPA